jgi:hypothetical protein
MKKQGNLIPPREYISSPATDPKEKETSQLPVKEFLIILKKLSETQETIYNSVNLGKQFVN